MATLSHRKSTLLLLLIAATLIRGSHGQDGNSRSSRREASDSQESTLFVGFENRAEAVRSICDKTQQQLFNEVSADIDAQTGIFDLDVPLVLFVKPVITPKYSMCTGMETTCCTPQDEKMLETAIRKQYRLVYHDMLHQEYFKFCPSTGKEIYQAMFASFTEFKRLLMIEANKAADMELPEEIFSDLFIYLTTFSIDPDICQLQQLIPSTVENIIDVVFMSLVDEGENLFGNTTSDEERRECLVNATKSFTQADTAAITNFLGRLLYDYKEFVETIYLAETVINQVKWHTFSPSCISALARIKFCAICGGYTEHPPCLNLCMNTFRGCMADVAEMHVELAKLIKLLREHTVDILPSFHIDAMTDGLESIVSLIKNIINNEHDLKATVSTRCDGTQVSDYDEDAGDERESLQGRQKRQNYYQPINPRPEEEEQSRKLYIPPGTELGFDPLAHAFTMELRCLDVFEEVMRTIPEQLCYLGKNHLSSSTNVNCWSGTALLTKENYEEAVVGPLKSDQLQSNNSAFASHPIEPGILYEELISKLEERIREMNETMEENKQCRESDDEDQCARDMFVSCSRPTQPPPRCADRECGSGSGSESGSGSGSGLIQDDTEMGPTDFTFEEQTTVNSNSDNNNNNPTDGGNKPDKRINFSNHFNDAPRPVSVNKATTADKSSPTKGYGEGTVEVINITPGRGDDGQEAEEDNEIDATPTRTHIQQKPEKVEKPKDISDGKSSSKAVLSILPTVVFTVVVSTLALMSFE